MSIAKETHRLTRFIHEIFHNIAEDLDVDVDKVSEIVDKWEGYKREFLSFGKTKSNP